MKPFYPTSSFWLITVGSLVFLAVLIFAFVIPNKGEPKATTAPISSVDATPVANPTPGSLDLLPYVLHIQGEWVNEAEASGSEKDPVIRISIDPLDITRDEVKVVISEYCQPGYAEYLHFKLRGDSLEYVGASAGLCAYEIPVIDYIFLYFEDEEGETILHYAAGETEYEDHVDIRMVRIAEPFRGYGWRCGLQPYLAEILRKKTYELRDAKGTVLDPDRFLSSEEMLESLTFFERYTSLWPMYEEKCVMSEFDIVVLGTDEPGREMKTYAVEWKRDRIELYDTYSPFETSPGDFHLKIGDLAYVLIPNAKAEKRPEL